MSRTADRPPVMRFPVSLMPPSSSFWVEDGGLASGLLATRLSRCTRAKPYPDPLGWTFTYQRPSCPEKLRWTVPRDARNLGIAFVVGYSGKVCHGHNIDTIITAMEIVQQHQAQPTVSTPVIIESPSAGRPVPNDDPTPSKPGRKVRWLFIGGSAQFGRLKREAYKRNQSKSHEAAIVMTTPLAGTKFGPPKKASEHLLKKTVGLQNYRATDSRSLSISSYESLNPAGSEAGGKRLSSARPRAFLKVWDSARQSRDRACARIYRDHWSGDDVVRSFEIARREWAPVRVPGAEPGQRA